MIVTLDSLKTEARQAELLRARAEKMLTEGVRAASRAGFSQREIAASIGRSQPEVSRLIRFRGTSPLGMKLRKARAEILSIARQYGLENMEVFGSVARGTDNSESDVDLLYTTQRAQTLFTIAAAEQAMAQLLGVHVDLVNRSDLKPHIRSTAREEAIPGGFEHVGVEAVAAVAKLAE